VTLVPYPRFTLAERERRWTAVRRLMDNAGLSCVVVPPHTGHSTDLQANARYLSHCGGGASADIGVIFPMEGDVTVAATSAVPRLTNVQEWVSDIREARRNYGNVIIQRLRELDVRGQRVGIAGLWRGTRTPEGTILYHTMRRLLKEFPDTQFVDASSLLEEVRLIKSDEEIEFLTRSNTMIDEACETVRQVAGVGVEDHLVWAEATATMLRAGSEPTLHTNWVSGQSPLRTLSRASFRLLERGDIILNELEASWAGYRAQGVQPVCIETCAQVYRDLMKIQGAIFEEVLPLLRPGVTVGELADATKRSCSNNLPSSGPAADTRARLIMHGRGQGDDGPIITPSALDPYQLRKEMRSNMVVVFKPEVHLSDGTYPVLWGDTVVVTENGGRRLGNRSHGIWTAGRGA
jgi:Xaa-Pro dipeptidase